MLSNIRSLTIYTNRQDYQESHAGALKSGLAVHGIKTTVLRQFTPCREKVVACWGWRPGKLLQKAGKQVFVMERGYVGDRFKWTSLAWNGLNGRATRYSNEADPARFAEHFGHLMKPWKSGGDYVLLIGQVQGDASLGGMDLRRWYEQTARDARQAYGLPVRFRPHPVSIKRGHHLKVLAAKTLDGTLEQALAGAAVVITFNSNTAVESVLAGVPTVTLDMGSMAREVTGHRVGDWCIPDRSAWAARLAWCQFSMDEIRSGFAWQCVRPPMEETEAA